MVNPPPAIVTEASFLQAGRQAVPREMFCDFAKK